MSQNGKSSFIALVNLSPVIRLIILSWEKTMRGIHARFLALFVIVVISSPFTDALADDYQDTIKIFKEAGESAKFFKSAYGYAVFPTIGEAGFVVGGAYGEGRVYARGKLTGNTSVKQVSVGFQLGGQAYSQIIFFEDRRAYDEFISGNFEFGAEASAVAITAGASASASTGGSTAGISGGKRDAATIGKYQKGMAVFTVAKGGLMYQATVNGQKFSFEPI